MEKQWIPETGDWTRAGVTKTGQGVNFTLELPEAETAELLLFQKGEEEPEAVISMGEKVMGETVENRKIRLNQSVGSLCVVLCLLVYAYYAREWERRLSDPLGKTVLSLSRHLIHAGLIFCWILSVNAQKGN